MYVINGSILFGREDNYIGEVSNQVIFTLSNTVSPPVDYRLLFNNTKSFVNVMNLQFLSFSHFSNFRTFACLACQERAME